MCSPAHRCYQHAQADSLVIIGIHPECLSKALRVNNWSFNSLLQVLIKRNVELCSFEMDVLGVSNRVVKVRNSKPDREHKYKRHKSRHVSRNVFDIFHSVLS